jgi:nucleotidyltransferase-like protein
VTTKARASAARAADLAQADDRISAAIVYGSVARGDDNEYSDLDIVLVARAGQREALWADRAAIAAALLAGDIATSQEPTWQRPFRFQAFGADLDVMIDLTLDDGDAWAWAGIAEAHDVIVDKDGVGDRLRVAIDALEPAEVDAASLDVSTWPWFAHLDAHLRRGHYWIVRAGLYDTLSNRVIHLLGAAPNVAEAKLSPADLASLTDAAPRSSDADELRRAMQATVALYDHAVDVWSARTGRPRPHHPLAANVRQRVERI